MRALSTSATTRLVNRLEARGLLERFLCVDDRRGIYTELTGAGATLLEQARPTYDEALQSALGDAADVPELAPLVEVSEDCRLTRVGSLHSRHGAPRKGRSSGPRNTVGSPCQAERF